MAIALKINGDGNLVQIGTGEAIEADSLERRSGSGNLVVGSVLGNAEELQLGSTTAGSLIRSMNDFQVDGQLQVTHAEGDAVPLLDLDQTGTNAGNVKVHVGSQDPEGNITANAGDYYARDGAGVSSLYVFRGSDATDTGWRDLSVAGGAAFTLEWGWLTDIADDDPGTGDIKGNNATQANITQLNISDTTDTGKDVSDVLDSLGANDVLIISEEADSSRWIIFVLDGVSVDQTTYWELPGTVTQNGSALRNGRTQSIQVIAQGVDADTVTSPGTHLDHAIVRYDGTGTVVTDSGITIDDDDLMDFGGGGITNVIGVAIQGDQPLIIMRDTDWGTASEQNWMAYIDDSSFKLQLLTAVLGGGAIPIQIDRTSSNTVDAIKLLATVLEQTGDLTVSGTTTLSGDVEMQNNKINKADRVEIDHATWARLLLRDKSQLVDEKLWEISATGGAIRIQARTDGDGAGPIAARVVRGTGTAIAGIEVYVDLDLGANNFLDVGIIEIGDVSAPGAPGVALGNLYKKTANDGLFWHPNGGAEVDLTAAVAATEFADDVFRIQDDGDSSKEIAFQASGITTTTIRTITMPDSDLTLLVPSGLAGGQTIVGGTAAGEDLILESTSHGTKGSVALAAGTSLDASDEDIINASTITFEAVGVDTSTAGVLNIDFSENQKRNHVLDEDVTSVTFTAPAGPGNFMIRIEQAAGLYSLPALVSSWPAAVEIVDDVAPVAPTADGNAILLGVFYDGTTYYIQTSGVFNN